MTTSRAGSVLGGAALKLQGRATLNANRLARTIDAIYRRRWAAFLKTPTPLLFGPEMQAEIRRAILNGLWDQAATSWNVTGRAVLRGIPAVALLAIHKRFDQVAGALVKEAESFGVEITKAAGPTTSKAISPLFAPPTSAQAMGLLLEPFNGKSWVQRLSTAAPDLNALAVEIANGLSLGRSRQQIATSILPLINGDRTRAMRIARTEVHRVNVTTQMRSLTQALGDGIVGWRYTATLDSRTRPEHAAMDGHVFKRGEEKPALPWDPNCRCCYQPEMAAWEDLGVPKSMADVLDEPFGGRASKQWNAAKGAFEGAPVRTDQVYDDWFNAQSSDTKREIVGAKLFDQLADQGHGKVKWSAAVDAWGYGPPPANVVTGPPEPPPPAPKPKKPKPPKKPPGAAGPAPAFAVEPPAVLPPPPLPAPPVKKQAPSKNPKPAPPPPASQIPTKQVVQFVPPLNVTAIPETVPPLPRITLPVPEDVVAPLAKKPAVPGSTPSGGAVVDADRMVKGKPSPGSNPGFFATDPTDGSEWLVKKPPSKAHAANELLANELYRALGVDVPELKPALVAGEDGVASRIVKDLRTGQITDPVLLAKARRDFAADAWLANWDVVGLSHDNLAVTPGGRVVRLDTGGALQFRAKGKPKGAAFGDKVGELDSLRSGTNPQASSVFGGMTKQELVDSIKRVTKLSDDTVRNLVSRRIADPQEAAALSATLIARKADLAKQRTALQRQITKEKKVLEKVKDSGPLTPPPGTQLPAAHEGKPFFSSSTVADASILGNIESRRSTPKHELPQPIRSWWDTLSSGEQDAIRSYTASGYHRMNAFARGKESAKTTYPAVLEETKHLVSAMQRAPKVEATTYRGIRLGDEASVNAFLASGEITLDAWGSTSLSPTVATNFATSTPRGQAPTSIILRIESKTGVWLGSFSSAGGELEVLQAAGTRYRVTGRAIERLPGDNRDFLVVSITEIEKSPIYKQADALLAGQGAAEVALPPKAKP